MDSAHDTRVANLDMTDPKDRAAVRRVANQCGTRWQITAEFRGELINALRAATAIAMANGAVRDMTECVKTAAVLENQNQVDQHHEDKIKRLDEGKTTENNRLEVVYVDRIKPKLID